MLPFRLPAAFLSSIVLSSILISSSALAGKSEPSQVKEQDQIRVPSTIPVLKLVKGQGSRSSPKALKVRAVKEGQLRIARRKPRFLSQAALTPILPAKLPPPSWGSISLTPGHPCSPEPVAGKNAYIVVWGQGNYTSVFDDPGYIDMVPTGGEEVHFTPASTGTTYVIQFSMSINKPTTVTLSNGYAKQVQTVSAGTQTVVFAILPSDLNEITVEVMSTQECGLLGVQISGF